MKDLRERCQIAYENINGWDELEQFAISIRNETLEEAATFLESIFIDENVTRTAAKNAVLALKTEGKG